MAQEKSVGFIGGGQMAYALAMGMVHGGLINPSKMMVSNRSKEKLSMFSKEGIRVTQDNMEVLSESDYVFLAVKPQVFPTVVEEIKANYSKDTDFAGKVFISVMAAITLDNLAKVFGSDSKIIRTMPSTPCLVGAGTIIITCNDKVLDEEYTAAKTMLSSCGECVECPEHLSDAAAGITGCAVSYFFVAIDALADGAVMHGMPRAMALKLASATVMGSGKLALDSGKHPGELKDSVASPGGVTIRGLHALEKGGFRASLINAVDATVLRAREMTKK